MANIVVSDTGPLIALAQLELLSALSLLFTEVYVTQGVIDEATADQGKPGACAISSALDNGWIKLHTVELSATYQSLTRLLDKGEAQALALAQQLDAIALIDERQGRQVAARQGITVTGTAAVLIKAKQTGIVEAVKPLIHTLCNQGYRLSERLIAEVLNRAGESGR